MCMICKSLEGKENIIFVQAGGEENPRQSDGG